MLVAVGEDDRVFAGLREADGAFARRRVRHGIPVFLAALPLFLGNVVVLVGVVPVGEVTTPALCFEGFRVVAALGEHHQLPLGRT